MSKAVKIFLFFSDLAGYYVRFWSRLFTYINAARRHEENLKFKVENVKLWRPFGRTFICRRIKSIIILSFLAKMTKKDKKGQKNEKKCFFNRRFHRFVLILKLLLTTYSVALVVF